MANEPKRIAERHPRVDIVELQREWRGTPSVLLVWRVGELRIGHAHLSWNDDGDAICVSWRTIKTDVTDRTGGISRLPFNRHPWSVGGTRPLMQCRACAQRVKTLYLAVRDMAEREWATADDIGTLPWRGGEDTGYDDQYDPTRAHGGNR